MSDFALEVDNLTRRFRGLVAVDNLSFTVPKGQLYGFLGLNAAGKTTTIRMLVTLLPPSGGAARLLGHDVVREPLAVRRLVGLVSDETSESQSEWTAREYLGYFARIRGMSDVESEVERSASQQGSVPIISVDVPKLVDSIARNIREAVSEATRNNSHAQRAGFDAMVAVMNIALNLLVGIEQRYANAAQLLEQRTALPAGDDPNDPNSQRMKMGMAALQAAMGGGNGSNGGGGGGGFDPTKLMEFMTAMKNAQPSGPTGGDDNAS